MSTINAQTSEELFKQGKAFYERQQFEKAIALLENAVGQSKKLETPDKYYAQFLLYLGLCYKQTQSYDKEQSTLKELIELLDKYNQTNNTMYATAVSGLAEIYSIVLGQYEKAEPLYLKANEIVKNISPRDTTSYAMNLMGLGHFYRQIGQYQKAELFLLEARNELTKKYGDSSYFITNALNVLAQLYSDKGDHDKALPLFIQAEEILKRQWCDTNYKYITSLNNLASAYIVSGNYDEGEKLLNKAIELRKKYFGEENVEYASSLNNLAGLYFFKKEHLKAELLYIQSKNIREKIQGKNHPEYAESLSNLALLYISTGRYEEAEPLLLLNNEITIQNLTNTFAILSENEKGNYLTNNIKAIAINNSLVYHYKKASPEILNNCFNQLLFFKSLSLSDTRNMSKAVSISNDSSVKKTHLEWKENRTYLSKQYSLPENKRTPDLKNIETKTETLEKELSRLSAKFRKHQMNIRLSADDIQKNLAEDEAVIEFVRFRLYNQGKTDSVIYAAYVLRKFDINPQFIPLFEEKDLQSLLEKASEGNETMINMLYRGGKVIKNNKSTSENSLYKILWQPLEQYLKGIKKIAYSPAGKLYSIAFHALPLNDSMLLADKYHLNQYSNTKQIAFGRDDNMTNKPLDIVLFGNPDFSLDGTQLDAKRDDKKGELISGSVYLPYDKGRVPSPFINLPGTEEEVKNIKALFEINKIAAKSYTGKEALEENLKALSGNSPNVLHVATHGFFLPEPDKTQQGNAYKLADDPLLRSGLILSGGNHVWSGKEPIEGIEDGIITAYEISQLDLSNTELVVLSACETGLGNVKGTEGVFGLQRAFKMAGVKKIIVSLWKIPDNATAELMTIFYSYWLKGKSVNESFQQAQSDMRKKYSIYYWAAFVLIE